MKKNRILMMVVITLVASLLLSACSGKNMEGGDVIIIAQSSDAVSLDPQAVSDQMSYRIIKQLYNTLTEVTEDKEIIPGLAQEWHQEDENTWVFKIREGVKFHNGKELKASDVKYTLDRYKTKPVVSHRLEAIEEVNIRGDYELEIVTKEPFAALLVHLSHTTASILNEDATEEAGEDFGQEPIGTGPFKFKNWTVGDSVEIERFEDYYSDKAKVAEIVFKNIPEGTNRFIGLETGEIDILYEIDPVDKKKVEESEDLVLLSEPGYMVTFLGFNNQTKPFDDIRVRKAINYAIDRENIIDVILEGSGVPANAPLQEDVIGANPDLEGYSYNLEKAKELLNEAGFPDGFDTTITVSEDQEDVRIAEVLQGQLKKVGIDVRVNVLEWGAYIESTGIGEEPMFLLTWTTSTGDADNGLGNLYNSKLLGSAGNRFFYVNKEVDQLMEAGNRELDPDKRLDLYKEAQEIIMDDAPNALLFYKKYDIALQKDIKGFRIHPGGTHSLYKVYRED